jgi:hypothetical protein
MREAKRWMLGGALVALSIAAVCPAQVSFEWSRQFPKGGPPGKVIKSVMHDFGSAPQPVVASDDGSSTRQISRFDGVGWAPMGGYITGPVFDLLSFPPLQGRS